MPRHCGLYMSPRLPVHRTKHSSESNSSTFRSNQRNILLSHQVLKRRWTELTTEATSRRRLDTECASKLTGECATVHHGCIDDNSTINIDIGCIIILLIYCCFFISQVVKIPGVKI